MVSLSGVQLSGLAEEQSVITVTHPSLYFDHVDNALCVANLSTCLLNHMGAWQRSQRFPVREK